MKFVLFAALSIFTITTYAQELASSEVKDTAIAKTELTQLVRQSTKRIKYAVDLKPILQVEDTEYDDRTRMGILVQNTLLGAISGIPTGAGTALTTRASDGSSNAKHIIGFSVLGGVIGLPVWFVVGGFRAITHKRTRSAL